MRVSLLVLLGPTGTGKSALALELADRLDGEIVGCDALQAYREFDVATDKPSPECRRRVPHHLVDFRDPRSDFSVADYVREADRAIGDIAARRRLPLVVGGAGMYLRGLLRGIVEAPGRDPELRRRLRAMASRRGLPRLHRWLRRLDPQSASRIAAEDGQRIVRALELALKGELTWSERLLAHGTWDADRDRYRALKIGLDLDRERLRRRIDGRVERFFERGLVDEVHKLLQGGVPEHANAFKAIGYREVLHAIERGTPPEQTLEEVQRNTRRYAKRQRTWFRKEPRVVWLDAAQERSALVERVVELWLEFSATATG
jgi:tRNA dimethylallyltransferase